MSLLQSLTKIIVLGLVFCMSTSASAQTHVSVLDSLEAHVLEGQPDTLLYATLLALTETKARSNTDSAVAYAWRLIHLADQMPELALQVKARRMLGEVYQLAAMHDSVEQAAIRAIEHGPACEQDPCYYERTSTAPRWRAAPTTAATGANQANYRQLGSFSCYYARSYYLDGL